MIEKKATSGLKKLGEIMAVMEATSEEIKERLPKVYSKELIEILFRLPYTKRQFLIDANMGTPKTVGNYLIALEQEGFLRATKVGKESST